MGLVDTQSHTKEIQLIGYADAKDRKSVRGYCFMMRGIGCVSWASKKQQTVALSTVEAEYVEVVKAASCACQEATYLLNVLMEINCGSVCKAFVLYGDKGSIALCGNPVRHGRSKHIDIKFHYIRDLLCKESLLLYYVPTDKMVADMFTKSVTQQKILFCCNGVSLL
eukprot:GHVS01030297.1.p1 GENE.GHVS01030297.1~~GHVS01030297.1.p1  ORF type:complete len:167 (+),score=16.84 GHVS01030297.1:508-1008(+)